MTQGPRPRAGDPKPQLPEVLFLIRFKGRTYAEIASALGISVCGVENDIAHAALVLATDSFSDGGSLYYAPINPKQWAAPNSRSDQ